MMTTFKKLALVALVGLFASNAQAEKAVVTLNINKLTASFEAVGEPGKYNISEAKVECGMKVEADGETQELDCSQQVAVSEGASLEVKSNGKKLEVVMISVDENGNEKREQLRGQLTSISNGTATYKMNLDDVLKKFQMNVSNEDGRAKVSLKVQGNGKIVVSDEKVILLFPNITMKIEARTN